MLQDGQKYIIIGFYGPNVKKILLITFLWLVSLWFLLIKLIQTNAQSLIGSESNLYASFIDATQLLLFLQPMDHHTLEVAPRVQFIFPVIEHGQWGHNEEYLDQTMEMSKVADEKCIISPKICAALHYCCI